MHWKNICTGRPYIAIQTKNKQLNSNLLKTKGKVNMKGTKINND